MPLAGYAPELWDMASGRLLVSLTDFAKLEAFSPDGETIAPMRGCWSEIVLWDLNGQRQSTLRRARPFAGVSHFRSQWQRNFGRRRLDLGQRATSQPAIGAIDRNRGKDCAAAALNPRSASHAEDMT
jgi:hypothetical protein